MLLKRKTILNLKIIVFSNKDNKEKENIQVENKSTWLKLSYWLKKTSKENGSSNEVVIIYLPTLSLTNFLKLFFKKGAGPTLLLMPLITTKLGVWYEKNPWRRWRREWEGLSFLWAFIGEPMKSWKKQYPTEKLIICAAL